jgi:hypothetical protein
MESSTKQGQTHTSAGIAKGIPMKKAPWFSTVPKLRTDKEEPVYHDNSSCMEGDNIPEENKSAGTDNRQICPQCSRLDAAGR